MNPLHSLPRQRGEEEVLSVDFKKQKRCPQPGSLLVTELVFSVQEWAESERSARGDTWLHGLLLGILAGVLPNTPEVASHLGIHQQHHEQLQQKQQPGDPVAGMVKRIHGLEAYLESLLRQLSPHIIPEDWSSQVLRLYHATQGQNTHNVDVPGPAPQTDAPEAPCESAAAGCRSREDPDCQKAGASDEAAPGGQGAQIPLEGAATSLLPVGSLDALSTQPGGLHHQAGHAQAGPVSIQAANAPPIDAVTTPAPEKDAAALLQCQPGDPNPESSPSQASQLPTHPLCLAEGRDRPKDATEKALSDRINLAQCQLKAMSESLDPEGVDWQQLADLLQDTDPNDRRQRSGAQSLCPAPGPHLEASVHPDTALQLGQLPDGALLLLIRHLVAPGSSSRQARAVLQAALLPKLLALRQSPPRSLWEVVAAAGATHPRALLESVLMPLQVQRDMRSCQGQVLSRAAKDLFPPLMRVELLRHLCDLGGCASVVGAGDIGKGAAVGAGGSGKGAAMAASLTHLQPQGTCHWHEPHVIVARCLTDLLQAELAAADASSSIVFAAASVWETLSALVAAQVAAVKAGTLTKSTLLCQLMLSTLDVIASASTSRYGAGRGGTCLGDAGESAAFDVLEADHGGLPGYLLGTAACGLVEHLQRASGRCEGFLAKAVQSRAQALLKQTVNTNA